MPAQRFEAEELDQATLDYLHQVVEEEGRGMPGLYYDAEDGKVSGPGLPVWGFVAGPIILLVTFLLTWDSTRNPVPVALLMTGGYLLGGWLLIAAIRCLLARGRESYIGYFQYIDPLYLWHGRGTAVEVEPLSMVTGTEPMGTRVRVEKTDGDLFIELRTPGLADEVSDYLSAIPDVHATDPVKRGYEAKNRVLDEEEEERIDVIPAPRRAHPSRGWIMPLVLLASVVALFFLCKLWAVSMRDSAIFETVDKKDPGWLRLYLIDPRNTRHRDEVIKQLEPFHNEVAKRFEDRKGDPEATVGMANLIRSLKDQGRPLITVGFATAEKGPTVPEGYFSGAVKAALEQRILTEFRKVLQPMVFVRRSAIEGIIPPEPLYLVDVAQVFDGPAMVFIEATVKPADKTTRECAITWTVTFQATPEGDKKIAKFDSRMPQPKDDPAPEVRALYGNFVDSFRPKLGM
jgi:hypothetical protein